MARCPEPGSAAGEIHSSADPAAASPAPEPQTAIDPETVCRIANQLAAELRPDSDRPMQVGLDSSLERDLGFDSLTRVELLSRLEKTFSVALGEEVLTSAETLRDLVRGLRRSVSRETAVFDLAPSTAPAGQRAGIAAGAQTLPDLLRLQAAAAPEQIHIHLYGEEDEPVPISHSRLLELAGAVAGGLQGSELAPGDAVALMLPTGLDYLAGFFGVLLAGCVPVPLYPPLRPSQFEDHLRRHQHILNNCRARLLLTVAEARPLAAFLKARVATLARVATVEEIASGSHRFTPTTIHPEDVAFLQYTSGSTGIPKGVILTHRNLLTNIRAMGKAIGAGPVDTFVSWLPLYHDMGLIGAWLGSLYHGCPLVLMSPVAFLLRPIRWLQAIHRHRGTLSAAPNFAYELCLSRIDQQQLAGLDLGSWRLAFNGAEPVSAETLLRFIDRFGGHGFRPQALAPVYGLAESTVGLCFPPLDRGPLIDRIQRQAFMDRSLALPAEAQEPHPLRFVSCGRVLAGHDLRVVDSHDHELPERQIGHLQFRGPSATSGYLRNPRQTAELFHGPWLDSGDLAYLAEGELYLTSRVKDIIIRGGRNISPYELEEGIGELDSIRKGCVAAFGLMDPKSGTERLVILAESRSREPEKIAELRQAVISRVVDILGMPPDEVVVAPPGTVLKTSSGKIRRSACRDLYAQGRIGAAGRPVWWQLIRLAGDGLLHRARQGLHQAAASAYAGWCWLAFGLIGTLIALPVALLPGISARWQSARLGARLLIRMIGCRIMVHGSEHLDTAEPLILVTNHQSYLDSLVLIGSLPLRFRFVAKAELARNPLLGFLLSRIGVSFVERFDTRLALKDSQRLQQLAAGGESLLFFAEGILRRTPGLRPFRMGAFLVAVDNHREMVPIALRGSRAMMPPGSWFPRRSHVHLFIGHRLQPQDSGWDEVVRLRDQARRQILLHCGEPDVDQEQ